MKKCSHCGGDLQENQTVCPYCGGTTGRSQATPNQTPDRGGFLWWLIGALIPLLGLILFFVWRHEKPKTARALIAGALSGFFILVAVQLRIFFSDF